MPSNPPRRLLFAFAISVLLHAMVLVAEDFKRLLSAQPRAPAAAALEVRLPPPDTDPLLKNTLDETTAQLSPLPPRDAPKAVAELAPAAREHAAQRKLAEHLFYPPEAIARGLEGEVRLLLTLDPQGNVLEARVASSSGHALLDQAATDAAYAMRRVSAGGASELILPVVFKLQ